VTVDLFGILRFLACGVMVAAWTAAYFVQQGPLWSFQPPTGWRAALLALGVAATWPGVLAFLLFVHIKDVHLDYPGRD
jgi:hypothetical protein